MIEIIIDKEILVHSHTRSRQYYINLGYEDVEGFFHVSPADLPDKSGLLETRKCDLCGKEITRRHEHHIVTLKRFGKDICPECVKENSEIKKMIQDKKEQSWVNNYGTNHPMYVQEIKEKVANTNYKKYGGSPLNYPEIRNKWENTLINKYGGLSPFCSEKVREKSRETLYKEGKVPVSLPQKQVYELVKELFPDCDVQLNYPLSQISLDVKLTYQNINIDIEYDGKYFHQDEQADRRRDEFTKSLRYKVLRIKSRRNIPTKNELLSSINCLIDNNKNFYQLVLSDWDSTI